jgi:two-component system OmpR family response regulator
MTPMPRLLFVDDDEDILDLMTRFFSQRHFTVATAKDGAAMFVLLQQQSFDLVVLDVMLPHEDGLSLCRRLRAASQIPLIMLNAVCEFTDRIIGLEMGADDYLGKPFHERELLARIKAVLRRSCQPRLPDAYEVRPAITFAGWRLDLSRRELRSSENMMVPLSGGEFDLLLAFVEHPQRVLTRDQLLNLARGQGCDSFDRSIDVQVSRLRRKIDADPEAPSLILTVRNGGYLFAPAVQRT